MSADEINSRDFGRLEAEVEGLRNELREHKDESKKALAEQKTVLADQSAKIDELIALANKGKGAFWIAALTAGGLGSVLTIFLKKIFA